MPTAAAQEAAANSQQDKPDRAAHADMTSRFLGLVVIPGQQITKIEVEERPIYGLPIRTGPAS